MVAGKGILGTLKRKRDWNGAIYKVELWIAGLGGSERERESTKAYMVGKYYSDT